LKSTLEIANDLQFQSDALMLTRKELSQDKSLVGFVGGPWTLLSFGAGIKKEPFVNNVDKNKFFEETLYDVLIPILKESIRSQLNSGAEIVYVFDTNAVQLEKNYFTDKYLRKLKKELFIPFKKRVAYFTKHEAVNEIDDINNQFSLAGHVYNSQNDLTKRLANTRTGFLQGNFAPESLRKEHSDFLHDYSLFKKQMLSMTKKERAGWICSLNHGILPKTPEKNVKYFIEDIRSSFESL
jgi:Uroporphyrinogen-III decarboxylase